MRLAAIDIGSNAARLLIQDVSIINNTPSYTKINLIRIPLRLGFDVFNTGAIGRQKQEELIETMRIYKIAMDLHKVDHYRACATSAMRDAKNGLTLIRKIKREIGIQIEIITGTEEAQIIYENHLNANLNHTSNYLYIDVGGGSTEVTLMKSDEIKFKHSFNIGTIRLLNDQIEENQWKELRTTIKRICKNAGPLQAIGSGGNINKVFSLSKTKENKPLSLDLLERMYTNFSALKLEERIKKYNLKEDRADVIVPALYIYTQIMKHAGITEILVPKIGVADGIIKMLYEQYKEQDVV